MRVDLGGQAGYFLHKAGVDNEVFGRGFVHSCFWGGFGSKKIWGFCGESAHIWGLTNPPDYVGFPQFAVVIHSFWVVIHILGGLMMVERGCTWHR